MAQKLIYMKVGTDVHAAVAALAHRRRQTIARTVDELLAQAFGLRPDQPGPGEALEASIAAVRGDQAA